MLLTTNLSKKAIYKVLPRKAENMPCKWCLSQKGFNTLYTNFTPIGSNYAIDMVPTQNGPRYVIYMVMLQKGE